MGHDRKGAAASFALSALALALLVRGIRRRRTQTFDQQCSVRIGRGQRPSEVISELATPRSALIETLIVAALPNLRGRDRATILGASLIAGLGGHVLKLSVPRDRPGQARFSPNGEQSFPSTHAAQIAALSFAAAHVARDHGQGAWTLAGAALITTAIAFVRVRAQAHWPTDCLAGGLLGLASAQLAHMAASATKD